MIVMFLHRGYRRWFKDTYFTFISCGYFACVRATVKGIDLYVSMHSPRDYLHTFKCTGQNHYVTTGSISLQNYSINLLLCKNFFNKLYFTIEASCHYCYSFMIISLPLSLTAMCLGRNMAKRPKFMFLTRFLSKAHVFFDLLLITFYLTPHFQVTDLFGEVVFHYCYSLTLEISL